MPWVDDWTYVRTLSTCMKVKESIVDQEYKLSLKIYSKTIVVTNLPKQSYFKA